jgi:hypothetical protein
MENKVEEAIIQESAINPRNNKVGRFYLPPHRPYQLKVEKSVNLWRMTDMKTSRYSEEQIIGFLK